MAATVWLPADPGPGVIITEHLPELRVQVPAGEPSKVKLTVPVGVIAVPVDVSETVAVHDEAWFTTSGLGLQLTLVEVVRWLTVRLKVLELVK